MALLCLLSWGCSSSAAGWPHFFFELIFQTSGELCCELHTDFLLKERAGCLSVCLSALVTWETKQSWLKNFGVSALDFIV